jgi:hypothetical protein
VTTIDLAAMQEVARGLYVATVAREHGSAGVQALQVLLRFVRDIYQHIEPENHETITVYKHVTSTTNRTQKGGMLIQDPGVLTAHASHKRLLIEVKDNGEMSLWVDLDVRPEALARTAVVYKYEDRADYFYVKDKKETVPKLVRSYASMFAIPTFADLREALDHYKIKFARKSSCKTLAGCWGERNRLFLRQKPEATMRDSLTQFLKGTLRNAEVRPEQVVDESHPVDIKVTWRLATRMALIEVKWLGRSIDANGNLSTTYGPGRVRAGAKQLAEYLDGNEVQAPDRTTRGYLVVFDARRRKLKAGVKSIGLKDGMYYRDKDVPLNPDYSVERGDFERPYRFFIEPVIG